MDAQQVLLYIVNEWGNSLSLATSASILLSCKYIFNSARPEVRNLAVISEQLSDSNAKCEEIAKRGYFSAFRYQWGLVLTQHEYKKASGRRKDKQSLYFDHIIKYSVFAPNTKIFNYILEWRNKTAKEKKPLWMYVEGALQKNDFISNCEKFSTKEELNKFKLCPAMWDMVLDSADQFNVHISLNLHYYIAIFGTLEDMQKLFRYVKRSHLQRVFDFATKFGNNEVTSFMAEHDSYLVRLCVK